jgi:DNA-binding NtrC family response regulator
VVDMIRRGAADFMIRPLDASVFLKKLEREIHLYNLTKKIFMSSIETSDGYQFENMIGRSKKMQDNFQMIAAVAKSNATVLITGESGVGKELVAQAVHRLSERATHKFVDINCGAIPRELLENELFGHEKGSFTGAHKRYLGSFETAHHGTLFLDEISEMDVHLQVKLLRVLQERNFTRVGGNERINVDVRIMAATNCNLIGSIEKGEFREDLFYRLNVINIDIPSLRDRRDDIPLLAKHFLDYYSAKNNRIFIDFSPEAMEALINYDWPGNVRELENTVERLVVLHDVSQVKLKHLPSPIQKVDRAIGYSEDTGSVGDEKGIVPLEDLEKQAIEAALLKFHGNVAVAAKKLKIGQATLYRKVKKFGIAV